MLSNPTSSVKLGFGNFEGQFLGEGFYFQRQLIESLCRPSLLCGRFSAAMICARCFFASTSGSRTARNTARWLLQISFFGVVVKVKSQREILPAEFIGQGREGIRRRDSAPGGAVQGYVTGAAASAAG
jgi:hypothetical protein